MDARATPPMEDEIVTDRRISAALARIAYAEGRVRVASNDLADCSVIVTCTLGLYAINAEGLTRKLLHGFFHGIRRYGDHLLILEICDRPRLPNARARLLRIPIDGLTLGEPEILAKNFDNRCHQIAAFDGYIHVLDTAHQTIKRLTLDGQAVDDIFPFPFERGVSPPDVYRHINSIALIGDRIALMLHNGAGERASELAWFDRDWQLQEVIELPGRGCHDIVADDDGVVWHCGSMDGELINSRGERHKISDCMTRGLAVDKTGFVVGLSTIASREMRSNFKGAVMFLDRAFRTEAIVEVPTAPMDLIALGRRAKANPRRR